MNTHRILGPHESALTPPELRYMGAYCVVGPRPHRDILAVACGCEEKSHPLARLFSAAHDYHAACAGKQYADITAIEWAAGIIEDFGRLLHGETLEPTDDPEAAWTAYEEAHAMLDGLRAAYAKAEGSQK